jgi:hypothetical protein
MGFCRFIPPYLLARVAATHTDADVSHCCQDTLAIDARLRAHRLAPPPVVHGAEPRHVVAEEDAWTVFTAENGTDLPGRPARSAGEPATGDPAVDEAHAGVAASLALFGEIYDRDSYDGRGAPVVATVHYGVRYDNAFWDGRQLVFGDGDGRVFARFTKPVDVLAHEFTHAVTQYAAGLTYQGQSGALNESMSDVFAACVKQRVLGQSPADADWLVGEGIFLPGVNGRALRSMAEPGTAYDDILLGRDPQVGHLDAYVQTEEDNGGVHLNSGIPNRAFVLAATALAARGIGATSWEGAGRIWYAALTDPALSPRADFVTFAGLTVAAARATGPSAAEVVEEAWRAVGIVPANGRGAAQAAGAGVASGAEPAEDAVEVRRTGGFAGRTVTGLVPLTGEDPRAREVLTLLDRIDFAAVSTGGPAQPDRFVYSVIVHGQEQVRVPEQSLTPELERLVHLVLDD